MHSFSYTFHKQQFTSCKRRTLCWKHCEIMFHWLMKELQPLQVRVPSGLVQSVAGWMDLCPLLWFRSPQAMTAPLQALWTSGPPPSPTHLHTHTPESSEPGHRYCHCWGWRPDKPATLEAQWWWLFWIQWLLLSAFTISFRVLVDAPYSDFKHKEKKNA